MAAITHTHTHTDVGHIVPELLAEGPLGHKEEQGFEDVLGESTPRCEPVAPTHGEGDRAMDPNRLDAPVSTHH